MATAKRIPPPHPGVILVNHFIAPMNGLTAYRVAENCKIPRSHFYGITRGERAITAPIALRLGRYFGTSPQFWLNLQGLYELQLAEIEQGDRIARDVKPMAA